MPGPDLEAPILQLLSLDDVRGAANQLVQAYASEVLGLCTDLVRDRSLADDLAQEAFTRAFGGLGQFRGESSLRTWLLTITRHICFDHLRRRRISPWTWQHDGEAEEQPDLSPLLPELLSNREEAARALDALEESDRALIMLRFCHGLDSIEIAEVFGIKPGAVRMRSSRALTRMRAVLEARDRRRVGSRPVRPAQSDRSAPPIQREPFVESPSSDMVESHSLLFAVDSVEPAPAESQRGSAGIPEELRKLLGVALSAREAPDRDLSLAFQAIASRRPIDGLLHRLRIVIERL